MVTAHLGDRVPAWDRLADRVSPPSPFLRSWWLQHVEEEQPLFVLVLDGDELLGGVALRVDRWLGVRRLRMLGGGVLCGDHLDAVHAAGQRAVVVRSLAGWLAGCGPVLLDLAGLVEGSLVAEAVGVASQPLDVAPYGVVPAELRQDYLATRSRNLRRSAGRADRRLAADGYAPEAVVASELAATMARFEELHRDRSDRGPLLAERAALEHCLAAGLEAGEVRLDVLRRGAEAPIAVSVAFWVERRLSLYQVARSMAPEHDEAGTVLILHVVEDAVRRGAVEIDLLRGDEAYKLRLVDAVRPLHRVRHARGVVPRLLLTLLTASASARRHVATARSGVSARRTARDRGAPAA